MASNGINNIDWNGPITIIVTGIVTIAVERAKRKLKSSKRRKKKKRKIEYEDYVDETESNDGD